MRHLVLFRFLESISLYYPCFFSHYYLVVIPYANSTKIKHPDYYDSSDLTTNSQFKAASSKDSKAEDEADSKPYITAKFLGRSIPYTFPLGDSRMHEGFQVKLSENVHWLMLPS